MNKNKKLALIISSVFISLTLIYTLFGFFGVPYILKNVVPDKLKDINVSLSISDVKFNPFKFELNITKSELNTTTPLFASDQLDVKLKPFSIFKKLINIDILRINEPRINISRDENATLNLAPFLSQSETNATDKPSSINFALNHTKIINGTFSYTDKSLKKPFHVNFSNINYEISDINTKLNSVGKHNFNSNSSLANKIDWQGGVDLLPLRIYGILNINDFNINPVAISFIDDVNLQIKNSIINTKINYKLTFDDNQTSITLKDSFLNLKDFDMSEGNTSIKLNELNLPDIKFDVNISENKNINLALSSINIKSPNIKSVADISLDEIKFNDINLNANIDKNSSIVLNAGLNSLDINQTSLSQNGINLANIKDINVSELNLNLIDQKIALNLNNISLANLSTNIGKNGKTAIQSVSIARPHLDIDKNISKFNIKAINIENIGATANKNKFANIKDMQIKNITFDLLKTALNIENIDINAPKFSSNLNNNGLNAINELGLSNSKNAKEKSKKSSNTKINQNSTNDFKFNIQNIAVNNADIELMHIFEKQKILHKLDHLNLKISNLSSDFNKAIDANLDMKTSQKLNLNTDAKVKLKPLNIEANVKLSSTNLPHYFSYAKNYLDAELTNGNLSINTKIKYTKDMTADGSAKLEDIELRDAKKHKIFTLKSLDIAKMNFAKNTISLDNVTLESPFIKAHLDEERNFNLSSLVKSDENTQSTHSKTMQKNSKEQNDFKFSMKNFAIENATLDFSDASLFMPFATTITKLSGKLSDIDEKHITNGTFKGIVGKDGFAQITAKLMPYEPKKNTNIKLDFKNIDLVDVTPYSGQFAGYKIAKGKLNLNLLYEVINSKLNGKNFINFDTLTLGEKVDSKDAVNLPLSLAISILSDQDNQINIDLPVEGDLNDPDFKYGGVIWAAIKKLFADITLAPFRLIGSALGIDSSKLDSIDFLANSSELISSESAKIADFIKLTTAKPNMKLTITPTYANIDEIEMKNKKLDEKINADMGKTGKDYINSLKSLVPNEKSEDEEVLREVALRDILLSQDNLIALANDRAKVVVDALIKAGLTDDRITVKEPKSVEAKQDTYVGILMGVGN
ncbi:DUF748 domain-containing protein [Campylobacter sp. faydin G-24]|uniref:DUF748 domain-containing protein n=1 Tax=Campylobacter anatolicus TaxID=2829105 RepID=A0ABS5HGE5_9BACT|nr:DUF748 domain-containing protein [Campylobacter anatolicus]MBR8463172.1 DUF748 domain-containing protein [Campylobacter anatolicus]